MIETYGNYTAVIQHDQWIHVIKDDDRRAYEIRYQ